VLLSVFLIERKSPLLAGLSFGLALSIKIVPVIFGLAILIYLPSFKSRLRFFLGASVLFFAAGLPFFVTDTGAILYGFATYNSSPSPASFVMHLLRIPPVVHKAAWFLLLVPLSIWARKKEAPIFVQIGAITAYFLALSPGIGVQHLSWAVPFVLCLGNRIAAVFYAASGAFLFGTYDVWAGGLPWYAGDKWGTRFELSDALLLLVCWFMTITVGLRFLRSIAGKQEYSRAHQNQTTLLVS
jgi:hypothetical protein